MDTLKALGSCLEGKYVCNENSACGIPTSTTFGVSSCYMRVNVGMLWSWDQLRGSSQISTRSSHTIGWQNSEVYGCLNLLSFFGIFVLKISSATMLLVGHPCKSKPRANTRSKGRFKSSWHVLNLGSLKSDPQKNSLVRKPMAFR